MNHRQRVGFLFREDDDEAESWRGNMFISSLGRDWTEECESWVTRKSESDSWFMQSRTSYSRGQYGSWWKHSQWRAVQ
jgi:hypothetical protein